MKDYGSYLRERRIRPKLLFQSSDYEHAKQVVAEYKKKRRDRMWLWLFLSAVGLLIALSYLQETVIEDFVQKAEAQEMTDYQGVYEEYEGQTLDVCAKYVTQ